MIFTEREIIIVYYCSCHAIGGYSATGCPNTLVRNDNALVRSHRRKQELYYVAMLRPQYMLCIRPIERVTLIVIKVALCAPALGSGGKKLGEA